MLVIIKYVTERKSWQFQYDVLSTLKTWENIYLIEANVGQVVKYSIYFMWYFYEMYKFFGNAVCICSHCHPLAGIYHLDFKICSRHKESDNRSSLNNSQISKRQTYSSSSNVRMRMG